MYVVLPELPKALDHRCWPDAEYLATKASVWPLLVNVVTPKFAAPEKDPATNRLPEESAATAVTDSSPQPPKRVDQRCTPALVYAASTMSLPPALVSGPP